LEVISLVCKSTLYDVNPVDKYGQTPLDNAQAAGHDTILALLCRAGGLPGSDPSLHGRHENSLEWAALERKNVEAERLCELMLKLPEYQMVHDAMTLKQAQTLFVQVERFSVL
jgi:ankyrin repeat protein